MNVIHHEPHGRASRIVEHNDVLYFEIHAPADATKRQMTMYEQATALLHRYDELLEQYGSDKRHVLRACFFCPLSGIMPGRILKPWQNRSNPKP